MFHKPDKLNLKSEFNTLSPLSRRILANAEIFFGSIFFSIFMYYILLLTSIILIQNIEMSLSYDFDTNSFKKTYLFT